MKSKDNVPDKQINKFQGYNEIQNAFKFAGDFAGKLDKEIDQAVNQFKNPNVVSQEELSEKNPTKKQHERDKKILDKVSKNNTESIKDDDLRGSISQQQKVRKNIMSEVSFDRKHAANKKLLSKREFVNYEKMNRGEIDSQISNILNSDNDEDPYGVSPPRKMKEGALESCFEDFQSDDESVYNVYWEEFERREQRKMKKGIDVLHDPMMLLEKLQNYSEN
jgi:hypothetical protein